MQEKDFRFTGYNHRMLEQVRELRKDMTKQERRLWYSFLRDYPVKFYRQRSIDRFVVDFYCSDAKLVIELDGSQHFTTDGKKYDIARTDILALYQLEVLRFANSEIDHRFKTVCTQIDQCVKDRIKSLPPPEKGGTRRAEET